MDMIPHFLFSADLVCAVLTLRSDEEEVDVEIAFDAML